MQAELQETKQTLATHTLHNSLNEMSQCHAELTLREKERGHHMQEFNQPMAKYHAMDMFDFEHSMRDCITMAGLAVPVLAPTFKPSADEESDMQVDVDPTIPVWKDLNSLCWMIGDFIQIQQMAGTAMVGYLPLYTHILKLKDSHKSFSGSRTNKDYWNVKKLELNKDILKE